MKDKDSSKRSGKTVSPKVKHSELKTGRNHHDFSHEDAALLSQLGSCPARVELSLLSGLNAVAIMGGLVAEESTCLTALLYENFWFESAEN